MQIKEIKWVEDKDNNIIIGSVEDCELFEIEDIDNVIILTNITSFDITYPSTIEEAKKEAKLLLNTFINKMLWAETINTAKNVIGNNPPNIKELKELAKALAKLLKEDIKNNTIKLKQREIVKKTGKVKGIYLDSFTLQSPKNLVTDWVKDSGWKVKPNTITQIINTKSDVKPIEIDWKNVTQMKKILNKKEVKTKLITNDNWKKQKRDSKGRFISKKGK